MATEVILPRVDMDMAEGKIAHWYVKDGEAVRKGQLLFEIETDKATMEVDAPADGVMHGIRDEIGVSIPVGQVVGWILAPGEAEPPVLGAPASAAASATPVASTAAGAAATPSAHAAVASGASAEPVQETSSSGRLRATPLARSLAREHLIDLIRIAGTGPEGCRLGRDVLAALAAATPPTDWRTPAADALHLQWARRGHPGAGSNNGSGKHSDALPLLLIHGFGADQGSWRPLVQHLPEAQGVIAIDLPGHGKSAERPVKALQDLARPVLERLDREGVGAFHLLGHSLGGGVALALARAAPDRVRSLTLLAPAGLGPDISGSFIDALVRADNEAALKAAMTALFHDPSALTGSFVATAFQQIGTPQRRAALARMAQQLMPGGRQSQSLREVLDGLRVPVQLIWGTSDRIVPWHHGLNAPPHVGLHLLPAVGHLPQVEAAPLVAALVAHQALGTGARG